MDVLKEIYDWSPSRPAWQQDALRRLIAQGSIDEADVVDLANLCKSAHGLAEAATARPLDETQTRAQTALASRVNVTSVVHHSGVNALANEQKLEFGPALTVVYGKNAAGKSGFTRILKRACRARGSEEIIGNILADVPPPRPQATIAIEVDAAPQDIAWNDDGGNEVLGRVSVFDSQCAAVYLRDRTDVAFRPFGLDIFDSLSELCAQVRTSLERERRELANRPVQMPTVAEGTQVHRLLSNLTSLTDPASVRHLATLADEETRRLAEIKRTLVELDSEDPRKTAGLLNLRSQRISALKNHVERATAAVSDRVVGDVFSARDRLHAAHRAAQAANKINFLGKLLKGTELDLWRRLWETARQFSTRSAYPNKEFPVTDEGHCVLCQQELSSAAKEKLTEFETSVKSTAQRDYDSLKEQYDQTISRLRQMQILNDETNAALEELRVEDEGLTDELLNALRSAEALRNSVDLALTEGKARPTSEGPVSFNSASLDPITASLQSRARQIVANNQSDVRNALGTELRELEARSTLNDNLTLAINEIERKKKLAAYELCIRDTDTTQITRKSTDVTTRAVTEQLSASFQDELQRLKFTHLEVELQAAGGVRGALYHKLILRRSPGSELPNILSEGEQRCLSIASFFAELSTADDLSAVLFDDPVSSLDHNWRERVAKRLVEEASQRQVIVFTHDIVFLLALKRFAGELNVECKDQQLRRETLGAGVTSPDLPWAAMKLRQRIGVLRNRWQSAAAAFRAGDQDGYERQAVIIYGLLRESWERGIEEILLHAIVERYRSNVQTQQIAVLSDITTNDCEELEAGMTKCSRWLAGHDLSAAEDAPFPEPDELKADIDALETWVQTITRRRR